MAKHDPLLDHLRRSLACKNALASLVKRYGVDTCDWALHQLRDDSRKATRVGRKIDFDIDALRDIWIFVEVGKKQKKQSVNAFCQRAKFQWVSLKAGGAIVTKKLRGPTLRRRYQDAVAFLRAQSAPYVQLAKLQGKTSAAARISPTEAWWRKLLAEELSKLSGN